MRRSRAAVASDGDGGSPVRPLVAPARRRLPLLLLTVLPLVLGGVLLAIAVVPVPAGTVTASANTTLAAALAAAVMSINIVKGVEFGLGFEQTRRFGSAVHDVIEGRREDGDCAGRASGAVDSDLGRRTGERRHADGGADPARADRRSAPAAWR